MNAVPTHPPKMVDRSDVNQAWPVTLKGRVAHRVHEGFLSLSRVSQSRARPRLVVFPCRGRNDAGSFLRTYLIADELSKRHGWRVTIVPFKFELEQRRRIVRRERAAAILMGKARHPLNRPCLYHGTPVVFDIDDADFLWPHARDRIIECCRDSDVVVAGSRMIADWCADHNRSTHVVWTGTPARRWRSAKRSSMRKRIVTWAQSQPQDYPQEFHFVQDVLSRLSKHMTFEFWVFGVGPGSPLHDDLASRLGSGVFVRAFQFMKYAAFLKRLENVAVGMQVISPENKFSWGKSFGKILAYLWADVAVVASDTCDHPLFFQHCVNGMLANSADEWAEHIGWLLENPLERERIVDRAHIDFRKRLTTQAAAEKIAAILTRFR